MVVLPPRGGARQLVAPLGNLAPLLVWSAGLAAGVPGELGVELLDLLPARVLRQVRVHAGRLPRDGGRAVDCERQAEQHALDGNGQQPHCQDHHAQHQPDEVRPGGVAAHRRAHHHPLPARDPQHRRRAARATPQQRRQAAVRRAQPPLLRQPDRERLAAGGAGRVVAGGTERQRLDPVGRRPPPSQRQQLLRHRQLERVGCRRAK
eukprot:scaffold7128_cov114-Isochrysis_galbana.AAC.2